ncbi:MAG: ImmA/IrrE family metallo-endopeptidase [Clostridiales bacterium]|nr:ImmA/IrrE family metallo-endopeptidase [Clostridiales bacterium]
MYKALDNSLFVMDRKKFNQLREKADGFNDNYNGSNIIQDDIFHVIENYTRKMDMPLEFLRYPVDDDELCACTFIRGGRIFIFLNSKMPLGKQIFAAGHELYHIKCYLEDNGQELAQKGSMLASATIDNYQGEQEEMEANAFSGLLLVPSNTLTQQLHIYSIDTNHLAITDVLMLMEIFAVPYKAIVLRLYEESLISEEQARELFQVSNSELDRLVSLTGKAKRCTSIPQGITQFGSLLENLETNKENGSLLPSRYESGKKRIGEIQNLYHYEQEGTECQAI